MSNLPTTPWGVTLANEYWLDFGPVDEFGEPAGIEQCSMIIEKQDAKGKTMAFRMLQHAAMCVNNHQELANELIEAKKTAMDMTLRALEAEKKLTELYDLDESRRL